MGVILFQFAFTACKGGKDDRVCSRIENLVEQCPIGGELPRSAMSSLRSYCRVSMQYEPEPDDAPGNLAELNKAALTECAGKEHCIGFLACLERNQCQFYLSNPSDTSLEFMCSPPARPR